ncbi:MAG: glycosyltransferase, partial [Candidatus Roizmanbacteria bacterium]|nr:glycosyltransferase [Candidatus Roizmanbacteria bacterium]
MSTSEKYTFRFLVIVGTILMLRYFIWWILPQHIPHNFYYIHNPIVPLVNVILFGVVTFIVFINLIIKLGNWIIIWRISKPIFHVPEKRKRVAFLTCFVPGDEPLDMLEKTLRAMKVVDYPHDNWVLDEGNDSAVKDLCKRLDIEYFSRNGISKYNDSKGKFRAKTKAGNLNAWRSNHEYKYDYVAQIDMDHIPTREYLTRTLGYFVDPTVGFVGMPQIYNNKENWIAKGAAEQSYYFYGPIMKGLQGLGIPLLMGTSHVYRVEAMLHIDGYTASITEDHLTGLTFHANGWKSIYVDEILAEGNGPLTWVDYFNQQLRWSYGLFEILFTHSPKLFPKMDIKSRIVYSFLQLFYFSGVAMTLGIVLIIIYLAFGINPTNMKISDWAYYGIPPFVIGELIMLFTHRFRISPKTEPQYGAYGMLLTQGANIIYCIAFIKFIFRKKLTYMVTKKNIDSMAKPVPLTTFTIHISLALITVIAIVASYYYNHNSLI